MENVENQPMWKVLPLTAKTDVRALYTLPDCAFDTC